MVHSDNLNSASAYEVKTTYFSNLYFIKIGIIIICSFNNPQNLGANTQTAICDIPNSWNPKFSYACDVREPLSTDTIRLMIDPNGKVSVYNYTSRTNIFNISGEIVYYV